MRFWLRHTVIARTVVAVGLTMTLVACGTNASNNTFESSALSTDSTSYTTTTASTQIDFAARLIDGSPITLREQLALRPVALWFWAPG